MSGYKASNIQVTNGQDPDGRVQVRLPADAVDNTTSAMSVIRYSHNELHAGNAFIADAAITGTSLTLAWKTGNTAKWAHMMVRFLSESKATMQIIEGPSWDVTTGSQVAILNRNRNFTATGSTLLEDSTGVMTATNSVVQDPTTFAGGTELHHFITWSDKKTTQGVRDTEEFVLKQI